MQNKRIKPDEWYSLQDIVSGRYFPWACSFGSVRRLVDSDSKDKNILRPYITGSGRGKKYHFKGENIIKYKKKMNI